MEWPLDKEDVTERNMLESKHSFTQEMPISLSIAQLIKCNPKRAKYSRVR